MELKYTNIDERGRKYAESVIHARVMETYTKEDLKNELISCYSFARQEGEVLITGEFGSFGQAIETLRRGFKVTRAGWNGKGMYLWLKPGATIKAEWCKDETLRKLAEKKGGEIEGLPTICMKTADDAILTGWLASQTDMMARDWYLVD